MQVEVVSEVVMEVRVRLRQLIEARGIKQNVIAARCGQSEQWLSKRLSDRHLAEIKADELPLLARALGIPVGDFFEDAPARRSTTSPALPGLGDEVLALLEAGPLHAAEETVVVNIGEAARTVLVRHSRSLLHLIVERDDSAEQDPPA